MSPVGMGLNCPGVGVTCFQFLFCPDAFTDLGCPGTKVTPGTRASHPESLAGRRLSWHMFSDNILAHWLAVVFRGLVPWIESETVAYYLMGQNLRRYLLHPAIG